MSSLCHHYFRCIGLCRRYRVLRWAFLLLSFPVAQAAPVTPFDADRFIDSIGVNIQLGGRSPGYADHARVKANLQELGIRHVRNPLWGNPPPYATFNDFAANGIRLIVPTGYNHDSQGVPALISQLHNIVDAVEGVEGVNEPDNFARTVTADQLVAYQQQVYQAIKSDAQLSQVPVLSLSLGNPYSNNLGQQLLDLGIGQWADIANSHAYPSIWMPEDHMWVNNMVNWANSLTPGKLQIMTETGYGVNNVSDETAAIYTPRLFLDLFCVRAVARSYIYQLVDIGDGFGGLYTSDGLTIRPQGMATKNLIRIFAHEPAVVSARLDPLDFILSGDTTALRSQLFQQPNGDFLMTLWRAYEADNESRTEVILTLNTTREPGSALLYGDLDSAQFDPAGEQVAFSNNDESFLVGGRLVILKLSGLAPPSTGVTNGFGEFR